AGWRRDRRMTAWRALPQEPSAARANSFGWRRRGARSILSERALRFYLCHPTNLRFSISSGTFSGTRQRAPLHRQPRHRDGMVSRRRQDTPASGNKKSPDLSEPAHTRHGTVSYTSHPLNAGSVLKVDGAPEPPGEIFRRQLFAKAAIAPRETDPQSGSHRKVYSSVQDCSKVVEWSRARAEPCGNQRG